VIVDEVEELPDSEELLAGLRLAEGLEEGPHLTPHHQVQVEHLQTVVRINLWMKSGSETFGEPGFGIRIKALCDQTLKTGSGPCTWIFLFFF
jgi:hypothetical protein